MNIEETLRDQKRYLQRNFFVKMIGIFGSRVRDDFSTESDIDILVELENGHNDLFNIVRLQHYLEALLSKRVDLVIKNSIKPALRDRILGEVMYV
ncbi:MAG: nucleotidyltransferase family protein [Candidatus Margulisiibacteriota bacterium]